MLGEREARLQREKGWLSSGDTVEAAAYDQEDGRRPPAKGGPAGSGGLPEAVQLHPCQCGGVQGMGRS